MITVSSHLYVLDNSGALEVECIKVLFSKSFFAKVGDILLVSIKRCRPHKRVKRSEIYRAVIVQTRKQLARNDGSSLSFGENCVILINKKNLPLGSRIFGAMPFEVKDRGFVRIFILAGLAM